jgi:hypothetical protein
MLLALGIRIPRPDDGDASAGLYALLVAGWLSYFAFARSFATVGIVWVNHQVVVTHIESVDRGVLVLNRTSCSLRSCPCRPARSGAGGERPRKIHGGGVLRGNARGLRPRAQHGPLLYGLAISIAHFALIQVLALLLTARLLSASRRSAGRARSR